LLRCLPRKGDLYQFLAHLLTVGEVEMPVVLRWILPAQRRAANQAGSGIVIGRSTTRSRQSGGTVTDLHASLTEMHLVCLAEYLVANGGGFQYAVYGAKDDLWIACICAAAVIRSHA
jgi:hypothetical protein